MSSRAAPAHSLSPESMPATWTGFICAALTLATALHERIPLAAPAAVAASVPAVLADLRERRLPNRLIGAAASVGLGCVFVATAIGPTPDLGGGLIGAAVMTAPLFALHIASPAAMGFGDVKAAVVLGAALGLVAPALALLALAVASAGTAAVGLGLRRSTIPFGPGLVGGAMVALAIAAAPLAVTEWVLEVSGAEPSGATPSTLEVKGS